MFLIQILSDKIFVEEIEETKKKEKYEIKKKIEGSYNFFVERLSERKI